MNKLKYLALPIAIIALYLLYKVDGRAAAGAFLLIFAHNLEKHI